MLCLCFVTRGLAPGHTSQDGQVYGKLFCVATSVTGWKGDSFFFCDMCAIKNIDSIKLSPNSEGRFLLEETGKIL